MFVKSSIQCIQQVHIIPKNCTFKYILMFVCNIYNRGIRSTFIYDENHIIIYLLIFGSMELVKTTKLRDSLSFHVHTVSVLCTKIKCVNNDRRECCHCSSYFYFTQHCVKRLLSQSVSNTTSDKSIRVCMCSTTETHLYVGSFLFIYFGLFTDLLQKGSSIAKF